MLREQLGNHIFLESGMLRTFDQLEKDDIGIPNGNWVEDLFFSTSGVTLRSDWLIGHSSL
jgi:hypothetical protein